jgi:hypothetical protein
MKFSNILTNLKNIQQRIDKKLSQYLLFRSQQIDPNFQEDRLQIKYNNHSIKYLPETLDTPATIISEKWGGQTPTFYNYKQSYLDSLSENFRVFKASPKIKIFNDVIYMPQYHCLYSSEGIRINDSCLYRGYNHTQLVTKAPDKIKLTKPLKKIFKKFIYVGGIGEHYGHFLTESIARLWYAIKDERYLILCHGLSTRNTTKRTFIDLCFEAVKLDKHRFISFGSSGDIMLNY